MLGKVWLGKFRDVRENTYICTEKVILIKLKTFIMANADQIITLIKSHMTGDDERFRMTALQIAALESKAGHAILARSINEAIKNKPFLDLQTRRLNPLNTDFAEMVLEIDKPFRLNDLVCQEIVESKVRRVIREYLHRDKLAEYHLGNRRKLLLSGPSGTGKTMTASILANELHLPLYVVLIEKVVTKFMGESSLKLSKVFDLIYQNQGVYLFDEFDAIGAHRGLENEVGEMRRILNSFLQFMERDESDSIIVAATNSMSILDKALFRRFDDVIEYTLPTNDEKFRIMTNQLKDFLKKNFCYEEILPLMDRMSHAEVTMICRDVIKDSLLEGVDVDEELVKSIIKQRFSAYKVG